MLDLADVDFMLVGESGPVWPVAEHADFYPRRRRQAGDDRFFLVLNWIFPPFQCVLTGALDPAAPWLPSGDTPQARLWRKFLSSDEEGIKDLFKVIVSIEQGPWLVKRACPKKPVLLAKKVQTTTIHRPGRHLEIVLDVGSRPGVGVVCGALKRLQLGLSVLIEARKEEELPENVLMSASMLHLDPSRLCCPSPAGSSLSFETP